jgi:hypothetical protein
LAVVVVLLLLVIVWHLKRIDGNTKKSEHYTGVGLGHGGGYSGQTSGASMRTLAQEFSGTNQQDRVTLSNAEVAQIAPDLSSVGRPVDIYAAPPERLVNERGEPDFWEIGNELAAYKQAQTAPMQQEAAAKSEHLYNAPIRRRQRETLQGAVGTFEDDALGSLLLR